MARARFGLVLHALSAFASFCARVSGLGAGLRGLDGEKFPTPEKVALAGVANNGGAGGTP